MMDPQTPQEFILEAFADPASVRDVVKGILHTIFFHRFFPSVAPRSREVLDITLPYVGDAELDTMIEKRADELAQQLDAERTSGGSTKPGTSAQAGRGGGSLGRGLGGAGGKGGGGRGTVTVQFFEKKRRKAWYGGRDEEVCWESWTLKVTVAEPRTESERAKVRNAMEQTLSATVMKLVTCVNAHKDHIPPITTSEANPFPYQIHVNNNPAGAGGGGVGGVGGVGGTEGAAAAVPGAGWTSRMGIY